MPTAALVLGIIALLLCWLPLIGQLLAIVGLIIGILAIAKYPARRGLAIAGTGLSGFSLIAGGLLAVALVIPAIGLARDNAYTQVSANNMRAIAEVAIAAEMDTGTWVLEPDQLRELFPSAVSVKLFQDRRGGPEPHYLIVPMAELAANQPLVLQNPGIEARRYAVCFGDGHIEFVDRDTASALWQRAQELRARPDIRERPPTAADWGTLLPVHSD